MDRDSELKKLTLKEIAKELEKTMQCNCDLDKWEPERSTGHSFVCRIHNKAISIKTGRDVINYNA